MNQPHPADAVIDHLGVGPVVDPRRRGGKIGKQPEGDQPLRGRICAVHEQVEQRRAGERPDHDIGEHRMNRVAEPGPAERVLERPAPHGVPYPLADCLGGRIERLQGLELADSRL